MTSDNNYSQHVGVALRSINDNVGSNALLNISIIENNIAEKNKERIEQVLDSEHNISFSPFNITNRNRFPTNIHVSFVTYFRIFLPDIITDSVEKIIYLDPDIIVQGNIADLWKINVKGWNLAAVKDYGFNRHENLKIPESSEYFNSGVMLINLDKWREDHIKDKALDYIFNNAESLKLWDQDALNAVLHDRWKKIHPKWNLQYNMIEGKTMEDGILLSEAKDNPNIIHYTSNDKPWNYECIHPRKSLYYYYLRKTPWKEFSPRVTVKAMAKRVLKLFLRFLPCSLQKLLLTTYLNIKTFIIDRLHFQ